MLLTLSLLALLQAAPAATPTPLPIETTEAPVIPVPLTAPACLAVQTQLIRVAEGGRALLAARSDAASTSPQAQAIHADWQHRIDAVDQIITNIRVAWLSGEADASLYAGLRTLTTAQILHEGERCGAPPAGVPTPAPTPAP